MTTDTRDTAASSEWDSLGGYIGASNEPAPDDARVRIVIEWDDDGDPADFDCGWSEGDPDPDDEDDPDRNGHCKHHRAEIERANRDGMTGIVGQYRTGNQWITADSIWGFIGNDWKDSGYEPDIMATTIEAYQHFAGC